MRPRLPERFAAAAMSTLDKKQFKMVVGYRGWNTTHKGLLLSGPPGVGKTWALAALTKMVAAEHNMDTEFVTAPDMFERYSLFGESFTSSHDEYRGRAWNVTYETVPWLVINDVGKEYRGGKLAEQIPFKLGKILRARSERRLLTHFTTNLPLRAQEINGQTIAQVYGESIVSLLAEMTTAYEVQGPDRRRSATTKP